MRKWFLIPLIPFGLALGLVVFAALFVLALYLIRVLWAWTVPSLLPGAVEQGLIVGSLTWYSAFKVTIFLAVLGGIALSGSRKQGTN